MLTRKICLAVCLVFSSLSSFALGQPLDLLPSIQKGTIAIGLQPIVTGMGAPDFLTNDPSDPSRLFVLEQAGQVRVVQNNVLLPTPALNIQPRIGASHNPANANDERGLLGIAFHPGYSNPTSPGYRTLYTYASEPYSAGNVTYQAPNTPNNPAFPGNATQNIRMVINEWKRDAVNPAIIDPASRREVFSVGKVANNHNGGTIAFGPDGYMYLSLGDGGNANDVGASHIEPGGNAVNLGTPLGKILRFDPTDPSLNPASPNPVSSNGQYRIPTDNPFLAPGQVPEIYAYGLRNVYRFSFDDRPGGTGALIAPDVGQNNIEEINYIVKGGDYGWARKEGTFLFDRALGTGANSPELPGSLLIDPIKGTSGYLQYDHQDGISITGGFVYRGTAIPELIGKYVFGDLAIANAPPRIDGRLFYADLTTGIINEFLIPQFVNDKLPNQLTVHGFGQDFDGELYALVTNTAPNGTGGIIYKFIAVPEPSSGLLLLAGSGTILAFRRRSKR